ncbi:MAG TPA: polysaccharide lyase beta-sandwich domain-containing protein, partial [Streptomyces sp.]
VFSLRVDQEAGAPPTAFAYALLPHAAQDRVRSYARRAPVRVLANSPRIQAVCHDGLGILAVNTVAPGTQHTDRLTLDGPASVVLQETRDGALSLAVADPTTLRDRVVVTVHGRPARAVAADDGVRVRRVPGGTRIEVTTRQAYGRSFRVSLEPVRQARYPAEFPPNL